ncbi:hypothetical protein GGQ04_003212 [Salinibacter ruber]|uniref:Uncharacterized protein n=1 Tax=Salinibacter ruber TaxID=146919 RepID=A0A9X2TGJ5_9BACT|nr:hypothetical protein [Salinibacter ruber]MCS3711792.1 hypothetical protein [Salinibacter ruber]MCS4048055.1 hypothetical protein [Salinibacter ruber]MCS4119341.1 hypothetical protein [Salinibacter ruber]MCS4142635.1 hypothetical protein [Salinibacter ruber]
MLILGQITSSGVSNCFSEGTLSVPFCHGEEISP